MLKMTTGLTAIFKERFAKFLPSNCQISPQKLPSNFLWNKKSLKNLYKTFRFPGALFYVYKIPVNNRGLRLCSSFPISRLFPSSSINRQYELFEETYKIKNIFTFCIYLVFPYLCALTRKERNEDRETNGGGSRRLR